MGKIHDTRPEKDSSRRATGRRLRHRGGVRLAITDVLGDPLDFTFGDFAVSVPRVRGGKMKGLGVTSPVRTPLAPEIPAIAEFIKREIAKWTREVREAGIQPE